MTADAGIQYKTNEGDLRYAQHYDIIKTRHLSAKSFGVEEVKAELKPAP